MTPRGSRSPKRAREAIEALIEEGLGSRGFRAALELEAGKAASSASPREGGRRDLTALATFTVDPASARDFDDAISAQREGDGVRIWVHIADVAAYVRPGSPLDVEARLRANSTYVPGSVEPMLPHALSSEACSLTPGQERLAVSAEIELGPGGEPRTARFARSLIRSDARLDYELLDAIFAGRSRPPEPVAEPLAIAREAAAALGDRRASGALEVLSAEPEFRFDGAGDVTGAHSVAQTESHRLIERLMILANEQVAQLLERRRVPAIYRVHAPPDPARVERLIAQLHALGVPTPPLGAGLSPQQAGEVAAQASRLVSREAARRGHGREAYTSLVLRSLKQALYSERNSGHAGLGSPAYCHFTSPIRRYPDLVVHRALLAALGEGEEAPRRLQAREVAAHCSERERNSARIEHEADDVCAAYLLERELRERGAEAEFEGEVSGVIRAGAFVSFGGELGDVYEGFLPARRMRGEYFELDGTETALVGRRSGKRLRLGDPVAVGAGESKLPGGALTWSQRVAEKRRELASGDVATNRRARHKFEWVETMEAGIALRGSEVKSLRGGKAQMTDSYAVLDGGEVWLRNLHIPPYAPASNQNHEPERPRKLLLHRAEIERLVGKSAQKGLTLIPTRIYFKGSRAKVELALARNKEGRDRRREIADRDVRREVEREFKGRMR